MINTGKNRGMKIVGGVLTAGFLMFGTASFAQERDNVTNTDIDDFEQRDLNTDQQLDRNEFDTRLEEDRTFDTWDTDRDGTINEDEFNQGNMNLQEQRSQRMYGEEGLQEEQPLNTNEEVTTGSDVTNEGVNDNGIETYNDWDKDRDGTINRDEFNQGTYNSLDRNQDGALDMDEYNEGINTYGTGTETGTELNEGVNDNDTNIGTGSETETTPGTEMETTPGTETETAPGTETETTPGTGTGY